MHQVPADRVIALLTTEIADLHREMAILKVQVSLLEEDAANPAAQAPSVPATVLPETSFSPALPPLPAPSSAA